MKLVLKNKFYDIFVSNRTPKKYVAHMKEISGTRKKVYFGDRRYEQFYDKLGFYKNLNHLDPNRRRLYYDRHGVKNVVKYSPKWFSYKYLW